MNSGDKDSEFSPQDFKQDARDARLSLKGGQEEVLRKKLQQIAKEKCDITTRAFAECAQKEGFWVIWSCRKQCDESEGLLENILALSNILLFHNTNSEQVPGTILQ